MFAQLYVIIAGFGESALLAVFVLLQRKTQATYEHMLMVLQEKVPKRLEMYLNPNKIILDFEIAVINFIGAVLGNGITKMLFLSFMPVNVLQTARTLIKFSFSFKHFFHLNLFFIGTEYSRQPHIPRPHIPRPHIPRPHIPRPHIPFFNGTGYSVASYSVAGYSSIQKGPNVLGLSIPFIIGTE